MHSPVWVTVIVLNWNGRFYLDGCLQALARQDYPHFQTVLVDNASSDDSVAHVRQQYPEVNIIQNDANLGFGAGNNVALRQLEADIAVLLNPDVALAPDALTQVAATMQQDPQIGVVGCKLHYPGGKLLQHAGGYLTLPQALPGHYGIGELDTGQYDQQRDVAYVIGGAMAIRRQVLETAVFFDEGFFLYYEDVDFCARAVQAGFRVVYAPKAVGIHVESVVTGKGSLSYNHYFHAGRWRYLLKHLPLAAVLTETVGAERAWLARLDGEAQTAVLLAYRTIFHSLPAIWLARVEAGSSLPTVAERRAVPTLLQQLMQEILARRQQETGLPRLVERAAVAERPFVSHAPLIGTLIARFRTAWNNVAAKWHVRHLLTQQNQFNQLLVDQLRDYETQLQAQQLWALQETKLAAATHEAWQQQFEQLTARIAALEAELDQMRAVAEGHG